MDNFTFNHERCLIGVVNLDDEEPHNPSEIKELCSTLGLHVEDIIFQNRKSFDPATCFGTGKVEQIQDLVKNKEIDLLVVDTELTPTQARNLETKIGKPVLDRTGVILQIFSRNARSKESKLQVEMAQQEYLLPRLTRFWTHLGRQRGGIGQKGEGEKQIEIDRRIIKDRIAGLNEKLENIRRERQTRRKRRSNFIQAGLVGYTNVGKSTLLNALTSSEVLVENKLFATLDTSMKSLAPISRPPILLLDTVGFISKLPTQLVASFQSTLEELNNMDLLIHVVDGSSPRWKEHIETVEGILGSILTEDKPKILVFNKTDRCENTNFLKIYGRKVLNEGKYTKFLMCSAQNIESMKEFRQEIISAFDFLMSEFDLLIPFSDGKVIAEVHDTCHVVIKRYMENGVFFRISTLKSIFYSLGLSPYLIGRQEDITE